MEISKGLRPMNEVGRAKMKEIFDLAKNVTLLGGLYYIYEKTHSYVMLTVCFVLTVCLIVWINSYLAAYLTAPYILNKINISPRAGSIIAILVSVVSLLVVQIFVSNLVDTISAAQIK